MKYETNLVAVCPRTDGGVTIIVSTGEMSMADVIAKDVPPDAIGAYLVDRDELPQSRLFRDAWEWKGVAVMVNLERARGVCETMRRAALFDARMRRDVDEDFAPYESQSLAWREAIAAATTIADLTRIANELRTP